MDSPSIHAIANKVSGGKLGDHAATKQAAPKIEQAPTAPTSTAPTEIAVSVTPTRVAPFAPTSVLKTPAPPVAPLDAGVNSAVLERLSMLESACKELRSLVIASTPGAEAAAPSLEASPAAALVSQPAAEAPKPQPKLWIQTTHVGSLPRAPNASDTGKIISQQVDV